ncbi:MAG: 3-methyl-2-oxobutanoate dehydrogenase subunit beta [Candidatus Sericytochromatia bacterium]
MKKKAFLSGSKAIAEGALYAGCRYYYSSPKPINNELVKYLSVRMPEVNGVFVQAENERIASGMLIGSSVAGARVMTSSITEGISAMEEGLSYLCGMELPCVIVNIMSGRFGLRSFEANQEGYSQAVRGASAIHKFIVLAPHNVQEAYDLTIKAFELADKYKSPVMILIDSDLALLQEGLEIDTELMTPDLLPEKDWKLSGSENRKAITYKSYQDDLSDKYSLLQSKFKQMEQEVLFEEFMTENAEELIVAFGSLAGAIKETILELNENGKKVGLIRPISLVPFPKNIVAEISNKYKKITVVESNSGLMFSDVLNNAKNKNNIFHINESDSVFGFRQILTKLREEFDI